MKSSIASRTLGLVLFLSASAAHAQHRPRRLEAEHRAALALLASEQNEAAYQAFRQLYERTREPRALWRMATAEAALQRWLDAEAHMSLALGSTGDEWVQRERQGLEQTLREVRSRVGRLTVRCAQPGAMITVAGQVVSDFPARVIAGDVEVRVAARGFVERTVTVPVPGNASEPAIREVELTPEAPAPAPPAPPVAVVVPPPVVAPSTAPVVPAPIRAPARSSAASAVAITGFALGGLGVATGIIGLVMRNDAANTFNNVNNQSCWSDGGVAQGGPTCTDSLRSMEAGQAVSIAGFVTGGVLLTGAAILWATRAASGDTRSTARARVYPTSGPGLIGAGVGGVW
jgi:hypothetical protein